MSIANDVTLANDTLYGEIILFIVGVSWWFFRFEFDACRMVYRKMDELPVAIISFSEFSMKRSPRHALTFVLAAVCAFFFHVSDTLQILVSRA